MATQYHPLPRLDKHKWLLTNGRIAEEPDLEESESGRRVRVRGGSKSVFQKDLDNLLYRSVSQYAEGICEDVWMRVKDDDPVREISDEASPGSADPQPHFVTPKQGYLGRTSKVTWTFRHESLPIAARISVDMGEGAGGYYRSRSSGQNVQAKVTYPSTNRYDSYDRVWLNVSDKDSIPFSEHSDGTSLYAQQQQDFRDWLHVSKSAEWMDLLGHTQWDNERAAAAGVARLCREIDSLDEILIPDLRDPDNPAWLTLKLHSTTYTKDFAQALVDFINGQPVVEQIQEHWNEIVNLFRRSGLVTKTLEDSDWHAALQGEVERLSLELEHTSAPDEEGGRDAHHIVGFNLATGTVTVTCSHRDMRGEDVATEYEVARLKAEIQGELDAFLGFHKGFIDKQHDQRHERTVEQRSVMPDDDEIDAKLGL